MRFFGKKVRAEAITDIKVYLFLVMVYIVGIMAVIY